MTLIQNKKAFFDYEIIEKFNAGIKLFGLEVKSLRNKRGSLAGGRVIMRGKEAFIVGFEVPPYQALNAPKDYDPQRTRKLLLRKKEINYLTGKTNEKGLTLIPLKVYIKNNLIKVEFAVARGLKKQDKREKIKKKEVKKKIEQEIKRSFK